MPVPLIPKSVNILSDNPVPTATTPPDNTKQPPALSLAANHDAAMSQKEATQQQLVAYPNIDKAKQQQQQYLSHQPPQMKKVARRSSKPIINWLQRKLAGTVRARSVSDGDGLHPQRAPGRSISLKDKHRRSSAPPIPPLPAAIARRRSNRSPRHHRPLNTVPSIKRNAISLDDEDDLASITDDGTTVDSDDEIRSSLARESTWSPTSEADEDASVRPLPPSSPPSPSPSRSSSSYLSDPRTFKSMAASTKPTTLLSIDLTGGMAHIAQAPPTPTHRRIPQYRTHSTGGGSITFSALPSYTIPRGSSGSPVSLSNRMDLNHAALQAPQHTAHHPRNNPRPSSPPLDNASMLTLASSAYAMPNARIGVNALLLSGRGSSADDSMSHISHTGIGDSVSHILLGELDDDRLDAERDQDVDASVRALRPRSSRRASWESEMSRWSARLGTGGAHGTTKDRSLWTAGSYKTGGNDIDDIDADGTYDEQENETHALDEELPTEEELHADFGHLNSLHETNDQSEDLTTPPAVKSKANVFRINPSISSEISNVDVKKDKSMDTPKGAPAPLSEPEAMPTTIPVIISHASDHEGDSDRDDVHSVANTDGLPDVWHSVPSTPMA